MKTHIIISEDWQSMKDAIKTAEQYLKIFGVKITSEYKKVDVSQEFMYETATSWSWLTLKQTKSLKPAFVFGLADQEKALASDCVGLLCDKGKAFEDIGLYGQQQTLGNKQVIEAYCVEKKKKAYGFEYNAYILIHELFHALADFYGVQDTLHEFTIKNKTSLDGYRDELIGRIWKNDLGLLPVVYDKAINLIRYSELLNLPIRITEGYRSPERQDELFKQKPKVTNAKAWESMHQYRVAFDIVFKKEGYNANPAQWEMIAQYAEEEGFEWGGRWKGFVDKPHFELTFGKKLKDFQENKIDWSKYTTVIKPIFERDLTIGSKGKDVLELQKYLNSRGFLVAQSGSGSKGNETEYFGELTKQALIKYQKANNITPAEGYFGIKTRNFIIQNTG